MLDALRGMHCVHVEDDAGVGFMSPGKKTFLITLNQANSAVNHSDFIPAEVIPRLRHKFRQQWTWDVNLGDYLAPALFRSHPAVHLVVEIIQIAAELV